VGTSLRSFAHPCNSAIDYPQGVPKGKLCRERPFAAELLEHIKEARLRRIVLADIASLRKRRLAELARIVAALRTHHDLGRRLDLVDSVPGIGERTCGDRDPHAGDRTRQSRAGCGPGGLAPFDHDSGTHKGQRRIAGGRARLRRSLFAAALPAAFRWNKALIVLYARLTARGEAHNAALVACARKLLIYANTVVQRGTPWTEPSAPA
jgi:transposase